MQKEIANFQDRRKNFRVKFSKPVTVEAYIKYIDGKSVNIQKSIPGEIIDLSVTGMKMKTSLNLSLEADVILQIRFELEEEFFELYGSLVWKEVFNSAIMYYGICFQDATHYDEKRLIKQLNIYQIKQRWKERRVK